MPAPLTTTWLAIAAVMAALDGPIVSIIFCGLAAFNQGGVAIAAARAKSTDV